MQFDDNDIPIEPKAGAFGVGCVVFFGLVSILACFIAAYMWTDADTQLAAAIGVASIAVPTTVGYFVSELHHQRSGALWFVLTAAALAGSLASWSYLEREDFENRMDLVIPVEEASAAEN